MSKQTEGALALGAAALERIAELQAVVARQDELLQRATDMLNPGREHRMYMDHDCEVCRWLGQVGDLTIIPPRLTDR